MPGDVVNEVLDDQGKVRASIWNTRPDYVEQTFRWAHEANPKALLLYNEAEAEGLGQKSDAVSMLVKGFKKTWRSDRCFRIATAHSICDLMLPQLQPDIYRLTKLGSQVHSQNWMSLSP